MDGTVDETRHVILVDVADRVAVVTLNRPESRNALNPALNAALPDAIASCDARDDVDAIVLTGADPAFCAGVDLKALTTDSEVRHIVSNEQELIRPFPETTKPVIGAINGAAVTGGFEVALTCDFLVASERARFADTHARVGIMPGWGLTVLLAEAVGHRRAREMSVTGNFVDAPTALAWGLVNHVVPHEELLPFCRQLATDIVSNDQPGVRNVLATYREQERSTDHDTRRIELRALARVARDRERTSPTKWRVGATRSWSVVASNRAEAMAVTPFRIAVADADLDGLHAAICPHAVARPGRRRRLGLRHRARVPAGARRVLVRAASTGVRRRRSLNAVPQFRAELDAPGFERFGRALRAPAAASDRPRSRSYSPTGGRARTSSTTTSSARLATPARTAAIPPTPFTSSCRRSPATDSPTSRADAA